MKIFNESDKFSKIENQIIHKINDDPFLFINCDILTYAKKINCSKSSISRLVKLLDFDNFIEMKLYVKEKIIENNFFYDINENETPISRINNIKSYNNFSINKTIEELSLKNIEKIANKIINSKMIHIFGIGSSYLASRELSNNFLKIGFNSSSSNDMHNTILLVSNMGKEDLLIIFTKSASSKEMQFFKKNAKEFKFPILVISANQEYASNFEFSIIHKDMNKEERIIATSSKICQLIISDIIFYEIFFKDKKNREKIINSLKLLKKWKEFI